MNVKDYKNKVRGCWLGKNIGGSLGAPFECKRGVFNVEYYTHDFSKGVLPNDDLDLQLVWLNAAENYGKALNAAVLAESWLSYVMVGVRRGKNKSCFRFAAADFRQLLQS